MSRARSAAAAADGDQAGGRRAGGEPGNNEVERVPSEVKAVSQSVRSLPVLPSSYGASLVSQKAAAAAMTLWSVVSNDEADAAGRRGGTEHFAVGFSERARISATFTQPRGGSGGATHKI